MTTENVRNYIVSLEIAEYEHCYIGKLQNKREKSIGVYPLNRSGEPRIPLGGSGLASYGVLPVSILIHWNKSLKETEHTAGLLFHKLLSVRCVTVNDSVIKWIRLLCPDPIFVGTDDNGVYEYVIEAEIYHER